MKIGRKAKIYFCAIIATVLSCFAFLFMGNTEASVNAFAAEQTVYEEIYVGDFIEAETHEISIAGGTVKAEELKVVYPSGGIYSGERFVAEQAGNYAVTYYATVQGEEVEETVYYLALRKPKDIIITELGTKVSYGKYYVESPYTIKKDVYGGIVSFQSGQSITFTTNIKTEKLTKDYNIIDMIVMPSVFKETDFEQLTVVLADADNPDNFVEIVINSSNPVDFAGMGSYIRAGAYGQQLGGYERGYLHTRHYGAPIFHSFRALSRVGEDFNQHTISENSLTISVDNEEKAIYCGPYSNQSTAKVLVNDLDDPVNYKANPWGGFTSEEITVKITANNFAKATGTLLIKSYGDFDFSKDIVDTVAPELILDYDEEAPTPVAVLGTEFPIIPFKVKDNLDAQVKSDVSVYYLGDNGERINVDCDGESFFVKYMGDYEVVYKAEDYSGNKIQKSVTISTVERTPEIFIAIDESEIEAQVYQTVNIPMASQLPLFGGSGALTIERAVYGPDKEVLDVKDRLQLTRLGEYRVVYKATDYLETVRYGVITINSVATQKPEFVQNPAFEKKLVNGFTYDLPQAFVVETVNGEVISLSCKVYVNGELVKDSFTADGEEMEIKYVAEGETGTSEWTTVIPVVDTDYGKYKNEYFYIENGVEVLNEKTHVQLAFADEGAVEFIQELYSQGFSVNFSYEEAQMHFSSMAIVLTDASNRDLSISVRFFYDDAENAWFMQMPGERNMISYMTSDGVLSFSLSKDLSKIVDASSEGIATIAYYDNGESFQGFSDALYFGVSFEGVESASSINITKICNQSMGYERSSIEKAVDEIKPVIVLDGEFLLRQKLGTKANIPTAYACDVLGQITEFTVTVEMNGKVLVSGNAAEPLDFMLNKAGNYMVTYYACDSNGNEMSLPYMMIVPDETAPSLTIKNSLKKEYSLGSNVKVPVCTAKDNGSNCTIQVMLILPNDEMRVLQYIQNGKITSLLNKDNELYTSSFKVDSNTFKLEEKGLYVLRVLAYDEYYNYTSQEIEFRVK